MKDKLFNFIDKYHTALGVCAFASLFGMILVGDSKQLAAAILLLLYLPSVCALMFHMAEEYVISHAKALQRLQDQRNSVSPHWDGQVRFPQDIEPRLKLLKARIEQYQGEMLQLRLQIAESDQTADS